MCGRSIDCEIDCWISAFADPEHRRQNFFYGIVITSDDGVTEPHHHPKFNGEKYEKKIVLFLLGPLELLGFFLTTI